MNMVHFSAFFKFYNCIVPKHFMIICMFMWLGLIRQPKWGHLRNLHAAIKSCSKTLLSAPQNTLSLGLKQQVKYLNTTFGHLNDSECPHLIIDHPIYFRPMFTERANQNVLPFWKIETIKKSLSDFKAFHTFYLHNQLAFSQIAGVYRSTLPK